MAKFVKVKRFENIEIQKPIRKTKGSAAYDMVAAEDTIIPSFFSQQNIIDEYTANKIKQNYEILFCLYKSRTIDGLNFNKKLDECSTYSLKEMEQITKKTKARPTLVPTGYKIELDKGQCAELLIRSSSPLKYWLILANSVGLIDEDYAGNKDNDGEIFFQVINLSQAQIKIKKGEIIGQCKISNYIVTEDDNDTENERIGGFGSTTK